MDNVFETYDKEKVREANPTWFGRRTLHGSGGEPYMVREASLIGLKRRAL